MHSANPCRGIMYLFMNYNLFPVLATGRLEHGRHYCKVREQRYDLCEILAILVVSTATYLEDEMSCSPAYTSTSVPNNVALMVATAPATAQIANVAKGTLLNFIVVVAPKVDAAAGDASVVGREGKFDATLSGNVGDCTGPSSTDIDAAVRKASCN